MKKKYIKMNDLKYLSLGNIVKLIKEVSNNDSAVQSEIFYSIFKTNNINLTTINNYLIGIRAVPINYKKMYIDLYFNKEYDDIVLSIINILDNKINSSIDINNNYNFNKLCVKLYDLVNVDKSITDENRNKILSLYNDKYMFFIECLYYSIVINEQPIYEKSNTIKVNNKELNDYMSIKLYEGVNYIKSLINLSNKGNMYASSDLGSLEYDGLISGTKDYEKSYYYYLKAADKSHPKACFMVSYLIYNNKVKKDINDMWKYMNKSIKLGSSAGLNLKGLCYLNGITPNNKKSERLAIKYFILSSENGYSYAYNNLGKIYENKNEIKKAIYYYSLSADLYDSWALNKMGEYYRKLEDMEKAYFYYKLSNSCPIKERCKWSEINLNKYFSTHD